MIPKYSLIAARSWPRVGTGMSADRPVDQLADELSPEAPSASADPGPVLRPGPRRGRCSCASYTTSYTTIGFVAGVEWLPGPLTGGELGARKAAHRRWPAMLRRAPPAASHTLALKPSATAWSHRQASRARANWERKVVSGTEHPLTAARKARPRISNRRPEPRISRDAAASDCHVARLVFQSVSVLPTICLLALG